MIAERLKLHAVVYTMALGILLFLMGCTPSLQTQMDVIIEEAMICLQSILQDRGYEITVCQWKEGGEGWTLTGITARGCNALAAGSC